MIKKFKNWYIEEDGTMYYMRDARRKFHYKKASYLIEGSRLKDDDWILHISGKVWTDLNDFIPAYFYALELRQINNLTIKNSHKNKKQLKEQFDEAIKFIKNFDVSINNKIE